MDEKIIFTDGSARGNPGPGGWGAIVVTEDWVMELGGMEEFTTNNRMELLAAISALEKTLRGDKIILYTDSVYVLSGASRWVFGWQKNNWKTAQKADVLNVDLWEKMLSAMSGKKIDWKLIKGHSGVPANERCDAIATSMADKKPTILYFGAKQRYGVSLDVPGENKNKKPSRVYAHSYVSMIGGLIETYKTWEECYEHVSGVSGALYKKSRSPEDEAAIIAKFKKIAESQK
jgi:ribonuclease HI